MRAVPTAGLALAGALLAASALLAGCGVGAAASALKGAEASSAPASPSPTASDTSSPTPTPTPSPSPTPTFSARIQPIPDALRQRMINVGSWHRGCPVPIGHLRLITLRYWGFDGETHKGNLVVARGAARRVVRVFHALFDRRYPIRRMRLIENFAADDHKSMAADNTSAFNGRYVSGTRRWSMHAYGIAIDINPVENPYVSGGYVSPPAGRAYADRSLRRRGMIHAGGKVVQIFAAIGWEWGGSWRPARDYQHFSANGR